MSAESGAARRPTTARWRLWAFVPLVLLVGAVALAGGTGAPVTELVRSNPPPADEFAIRRVTFEPGEIRIRVTNPQQADLTIATVTVDDAVVPYELDGPGTLGRLRSATIVVPFDWVQDDPITVGVTSSSGIQTTEAIPAAVETPGVSGGSILGYGLIGLLVGVVPVALGLLWLPTLRQTAPEWLAAFMALTAGLLSFLAVEALSEALTLQAALPSAVGGAGVVLLGFALSYLTLTLLSHRLGRGSAGSAGPLRGLALATLVAIGIGLHNFGEGLAIGSSFALGELALGTFFIVGFMLHNVTEGLGIAAPAAEDGEAVRFSRLAVLALVAGAPAILGAWLGGFFTSDILAVVFFAAAAGAAAEVVLEVVRFVARKAPGGLTSPHVIGGFLAGLAVMYATGLLV
ncbi:MAG: metal transporter [Actinobacteria bacterium]|nr:metal transporter [Actinomycetota bacterium]